MIIQSEDAWLPSDSDCPGRNRAALANKTVSDIPLWTGNLQLITSKKEESDENVLLQILTQFHMQALLTQ